MSANPTTGHRREYRIAAWLCAVLSAGHCALIAAVLLAIMVQDKTRGPLVAQDVLEIRGKLHTSPADDALKAALRQADARTRDDFLRRDALRKRGAWLLLASAVALVISLKSIRLLEKRSPVLGDIQVPLHPEPRWAHWSVLGAGSAVAAVFGAGAWMATGMPSAQSLAAPERQPVKIAWPDETALLENWPVFRGWGGNGCVTGTAFPTRWNGKTGENIAWKSPVDLPGNSSPIVWGESVFLTGATDEARALYCFSADTGALRWTCPVPATMTDGLEGFEDTGWAAPTPATDGTHVYAIFPTGDIVAVDFAGHVVWRRYLGKPVSQYTYAASPAVYQGKVIVQWDVGNSDKGSSSALLALDGATGKTLWRTPRPVANSWSSPIVTRGPAPQVVTSGSPWVAGYDALSGAELWRAKLLESDVACTPAALDGVAYVANDHAIIAALPLDSRAEVAPSQLKWQAEEGLPDIVSPTSDGKRVWTITSNGTLFCFASANGRKLYEAPIGGPVNASPVLVSGLLWVTDLRGNTHFVRAADSFEKVGEAALQESVRASPALARGRVFFRTSKHLVCVTKSGGGT